MKKVILGLIFTLTVSCQKSSGPSSPPLSASADAVQSPQSATLLSQVKVKVGRFELLYSVFLVGFSEAYEFKIVTFLDSGSQHLQNIDLPGFKFDSQSLLKQSELQSLDGKKPEPQSFELNLESSKSNLSQINYRAIFSCRTHPEWANLHQTLTSERRKIYLRFGDFMGFEGDHSATDFTMDIDSGKIEQVSLKKSPSLIYSDRSVQILFNVWSENGQLLTDNLFFDATDYYYSCADRGDFNQLKLDEIFDFGLSVHIEDLNEYLKQKSALEINKSERVHDQYWDSFFKTQKPKMAVEAK